MAPMVHGLEAQYSGRVKFSYLDADDLDTDTFQRTLGFAYQPEFYLVNAEGRVLTKLVGFITEDDFKNVLNSYLQ
jgi:thioredoxin-like negative regulator of GroEL